ncbi:hypothetical protein BRADI_1g08451v3 [Brachypodium distachyon]|uniref:Subtilisin-like protease n=1 Tax=Brachypodium distachyon TaxID=15368 RepID=A0A0Q3N909_BRADI|nr:hypothetical protein BRADI_1g08451v3 [Brachypodium distachyon]
MASRTFIFLQYSLLFLTLLQSTHSAITLKPKNTIEQKTQTPSTSNTYIIQTNHLSKPSRFTTLDHWYASMVATNSTGRILHTYDTVMHGFAVRLTDAEARRMSRIPGVFGVHRDRVYHTQTTRSPGFIGLHADFGAWPDSEFGDNVIIGVVDTGISPASSSFNDSGLGPVRPGWKGKCVDAEGFSASSCNRKLVGDKVFINEEDGIFTPRDKLGHGTHVASTAAGSKVQGANMLGFSQGSASGVARMARIAMYKACNTLTCTESAIVAAIDAAVSDGVDIISLSLGKLQDPAFYDDMVAVARFGATRRGVFVVFAGGNSGPIASTVSNVAPWMTTVGAATTDRVFPGRLRLGNGVVLTGQSLYDMKAQGMNMTQLETDLAPDKVMGKIVVCTGMEGASNGFYVQRAGGAGVVSVDSDALFSDGVMVEAYSLPGLTLSTTGRKKLDAYMVSAVPYPVASFSFSSHTVTGETREPMVAGFSSRGPNRLAPELLKPDIVAPGMNILAAWPGDIQPTNEAIDLRRVEYNIMSGTSMACPHVAGVAALIRKRDRDWTPAMVRSAMMTTTATLDMNGRGIVDNGSDNDTTPLEAGAGLVLPRLAMDPGLVYDAGANDYVAFLCSLNYTVEQVRRFEPDLASCPRTPPGDAPSMVVVFDGHIEARALTRTLTKVSLHPETYHVTTAAPAGIKVVVTPATLEFKQPKEKKTYTVEFRRQEGGSGKPAGSWDFGYVSLENRKHRVRSPVAFLWNN